MEETLDMRLSAPMRCPRCRKSTIKTTCIGFDPKGKDPNRAICYAEGCGWAGMADDTRWPDKTPHPDRRKG